jgi:hypothetical protein
MWHPSLDNAPRAQPNATLPYVRNSVRYGNQAQGSKWLGGSSCWRSALSLAAACLLAFVAVKGPGASLILGLLVCLLACLQEDSLRGSLRLPGCSYANA